MYDPTETELSLNLLKEMSRECDKKNIRIAIIGGWATFFYVDNTYSKAFGKNYMGSRDIDISFDHSKEDEFHKLIKDLGFTPNGMYFRWERIYNRESKKYISQKDAEKEEIFNLIHIFLDLFCDRQTNALKSWHLEPLKHITYFNMNGFSLANIDTLIALKCIALFSRDKSDKENKDACDLYALIAYSQQKIKHSKLLKKAIEKIIYRSDLLYVIAQHVLLDPARQSIVQYALTAKLREFEDEN
ncbi:hypothetical protein J4401_02435 [Candidatus Woesearchaeota archaeon]|nr:hypothetical protein [Candidatus Woesearchaeota archaeon]